MSYGIARRSADMVDSSCLRACCMVEQERTYLQHPKPKLLGASSRPQRPSNQTACLSACCGLLDSVCVVTRVGDRSNEALVGGRSCIVDVVVAKSRSNVKFKHPRLYMSLQATNRTSSVSLRLPKRASRGKKRVDFGFVTPQRRDATFQIWNTLAPHARSNLILGVGPQFRGASHSPTPVKTFLTGHWEATDINSFITGYIFIVRYEFISP